MNGTRILAVDPGRMSLGVAVFEGASLRYYAIKALRVPGTPREVRRAAACAVEALIDHYQPTHVAVEQPLVVQRRAELLAHVIGAIKTTARRHALVVSEHAPRAVRGYVCGGAKPTKRGVAERLAALYPELARYASGRGRWAGRYYERMFGAVAVGLFARATPGRTRTRDNAGPASAPAGLI